MNANGVIITMAVDLCRFVVAFIIHIPVIMQTCVLNVFSMQPSNVNYKKNLNQILKINRMCTVHFCAEFEKLR